MTKLLLLFALFLLTVLWHFYWKKLDENDRLRRAIGDAQRCWKIDDIDGLEEALYSEGKQFKEFQAGSDGPKGKPMTDKNVVIELFSAATMDSFATVVVDEDFDAYEALISLERRWGLKPLQARSPFQLRLVVDGKILSTITNVTISDLPTIMKGMHKSYIAQMNM